MSQEHDVKNLLVGGSSDGVRLGIFAIWYTAEELRRQIQLKRETTYKLDGLKIILRRQFFRRSTCRQSIFGEKIDFHAKI